MPGEGLVKGCPTLCTPSEPRVAYSVMPSTLQSQPQTCPRETPEEMGVRHEQLRSGTSRGLWSEQTVGSGTEPAGGQPGQQAGVAALPARPGKELVHATVNEESAHDTRPVLLLKDGQTGKIVTHSAIKMKRCQKILFKEGTGPMLGS